MTESGLAADARRLSVLIGADGAVRIPARLAPWVCSVLGREIADIRRRGRGGNLASDVLELLDALEQGSDHGTEETPGGTMDVGRFLSTGEVASILECSSRAVTKAIAAGRLAGNRVGDVWLVAETDLEKYRHEKGQHRGRAA